MLTCPFHVNYRVGRSEFLIFFIFLIFLLLLQFLNLCMFKMQPPSSVYIGCYLYRIELDIVGRVLLKYMTKIKTQHRNRVKFVCKLTILLVFERKKRNKRKNILFYFLKKNTNKTKQKNTDREFPDFTVGRKGQVNIFFFLA